MEEKIIWKYAICKTAKLLSLTGGEMKEKVLFFYHIS